LEPTRLDEVKMEREGERKMCLLGRGKQYGPREKLEELKTTGVAGVRENKGRGRR